MWKNGNLAQLTFDVSCNICEDRQTLCSGCDSGGGSGPFVDVSLSKKLNIKLLLMVANTLGSSYTTNVLCVCVN